jgi:hypothetical protein
MPRELLRRNSAQIVDPLAVDPPNEEPVNLPPVEDQDAQEEEDADAANQGEMPSQIIQDVANNDLQVNNDPLVIKPTRQQLIVATTASHKKNLNESGFSEALVILQLKNGIIDLDSPEITAMEFQNLNS